MRRVIVVSVAWHLVLVVSYCKCFTKATFGWNTMRSNVDKYYTVAAYAIPPV